MVYIVNLLISEHGCLKLGLLKVGHPKLVCDVWNGKKEEENHES